MPNDLLIAFMFFGLGSIIGSFLNVCIVRLPRNESVAFPGSHCMECNEPIKWFHNIPLISYLMLLGKCSCSESKIPFRYFLIEFLTAVTFLGFYFIYGVDAIVVPYLVMMCCLIVSTFVDFEHRIIPDEVSIGGMCLGILLSPFFIHLHADSIPLLEVGQKVVWVIAAVLLVLELGHSLLIKKVFGKEEKEFLVIISIFLVLEYVASFIGLMLPRYIDNGLSLQAAIQGAFIGGGMIYVMGLIGDYIFKKESMGGGDVKLMALIGAFIGWKLAIVAFFIAPFFGAIVGIIEKIRTKDSTIAYGPYLALGALISLFWGDLILFWVINGYHLP